MKLFKKKHILDSCTYYLKYKNYLDVYRNGIFYKRLDGLIDMMMNYNDHYDYSSFDKNLKIVYFDSNFNVIDYHPYYINISVKNENDEYTLYLDNNKLLKSTKSFNLCENVIVADFCFTIYTLTYNDEKYIIYDKHLIKGDYKHIVNIYPEYEIIEFKNILTYYKNFDNNIVDESEIKKLILK